MRELKEKGASAGVSLDDFVPVFEAFLNTMGEQTEAMVRQAAKETAGQTQQDKMNYLLLLQQRKGPEIQARCLAAVKATAAARGIGVEMDEDMFQSCMLLHNSAPRLRPIIQAHQERMSMVSRVITG